MNRIAPVRTCASICVVVVAAWAMAACAPDNPTLPSGAPPAHTVVKGGVAHMDGLYQPTNNCARCHGHTLEGGADGEPSCYECHDRNW